MRRAVLLAVTAGLLLMACGGGDDEPPPTTTTTTEVAPDEPAAEALLRAEDLPGPEPWEVRVPLGDYEDEQDRILVCDVDVRAEVGAEGGVYARYQQGAVQVTNAVTTLPSTDAERLVTRFDEVASACAAPWTQTGPTGEVLTHEITGSLPLPDIDVLGAAYTIHTTSERGESQTVVVVLQSGAAVSGITYGGPVGSDLSDIEAIVQAGAERLASIS